MKTVTQRGEIEDELFALTGRARQLRISGAAFDEMVKRAKTAAGLSAPGRKVLDDEAALMAMGATFFVGEPPQRTIFGAAKFIAEIVQSFGQDELAPEIACALPKGNQARSLMFRLKGKFQRRHLERGFDFALLYTVKSLVFGTIDLSTFPDEVSLFVGDPWSLRLDDAARWLPNLMSAARKRLLALGAGKAKIGAFTYYARTDEFEFLSPDAVASYLGIPVEEIGVD